MSPRYICNEVTNKKNARFARFFILKLNFAYRPLDMS